MTKKATIKIPVAGNSRMNDVEAVISHPPSYWVMYGNMIMMAVIFLGLVGLGLISIPQPIALPAVVTDASTHKERTQTIRMTVDPVREGPDAGRIPLVPQQLIFTPKGSNQEMIMRLVEASYDQKRTQLELVLTMDKRFPGTDGSGTALLEFRQIRLYELFLRSFAK